MLPDPARPLRVAMFAPWREQCGIRDYSALLIRELDALPDVESIRIVSAPPDAARIGSKSVLTHYREDEERFGRLGDAMNVGADVAHVQHQYFLFGGVAPYKSHVTAFLNRIKVPILLTVHEIAAESGGWVNRWGVRTANRNNFFHPAIQAIIVHTDADRLNLLRTGVPERKVRVIHHPVPPALPMPEAKSARVALEAAFPSLAGHRLITLFGFLSVKKGHGVALDALKHLPDDVVLVFAGGRHPDDHTEYVAALHREIESRGLRDRVVITGYLAEDQVANIMAVTDVALAPFLRTSGSGSLANLMAYGRAVVASDIAPHRELLAARPGVLSLVSTEDPDALASEICALLADANRRDSFQQAALAYASTNTYAQFARQTAELYREIVAA